MIIYGENGVGKSQAVARACRELNCGQIYWLIASNWFSLQRDIKKCFHISISRLKEKIDLKKFLPLEDCTGQDIIVFDNIRNNYLLEQIIGMKCEAHIVATTSLSVGLPGEGYESICLQRWDVEVSQDFLKNRRYKEWRKVLSRDGLYLPLTLELFVAYYREWGICKVDSSVDSIPRTFETKSYVSAMYRLLERDEKKWHNALEVIRFCSLLDGELLSRFIIKKLTGISGEILEETLSDLKNLALVQSRKDKIHIFSQVQNAISICMGTELLIDYKDKIINEIKKAFDTVHIDPWKLEEGREWRIHSEALLNQDDSEHFTDQELELCISICKYDFATGEYDSAEKLANMVERRARQRDLCKLCCQAMLEKIRLLELENENSKVLEKVELLRIEFPNLIKEYPDLYVDMLLLASQANENQGLFRQAEAIIRNGFELLEKNTEINEAIWKEKKIALLNGLGKAFLLRNRPRRALQIFNQALTLNESYGGFQEAYLYGNMANALYSLRRYDDAIECLSKQRRIYKSADYGGASDEELSNIIAFMKIYQKKKGEESKVEAYFNLGLRRIKASDVKYRNNQLYLYNNYGTFCYRMGKLDEAFDVLSEGVESSERKGDKEENRIRISLFLNRAIVQCKKEPYQAIQDVKMALKKCNGQKKEFAWAYRIGYMVRLRCEINCLIRRIEFYILRRRP